MQSAERERGEKEQKEQKEFDSFGIDFACADYLFVCENRMWVFKKEMVLLVQDTSSFSRRCFKCGVKNVEKESSRNSKTLEKLPHLGE